MSREKQNNTPTNTPTQNQFTNSELKQIKEIAKDLCQNTMCGLDEWNECELSDGVYCLRCTKLAINLFNAGYRKQSAIIRCKDCEHYGLNSPIIKNKHCLYFSGYDEIFTEPNDYCSFAKMKGGAE